MLTNINKKLLLYLAVVAGAVFLVFVGIPVRYAIVNDAEQEARMYQTAIQTTSDEQLNYSIDTKQGRVLSPVTIKAVGKVKFDEMNKSFSKVEKVEERYTRHTREVCETHYRTETRTRTVYDADGNSSTETYTVEVPYDVCHTEVYYTWDYQQSWDKSAKEVDMAGRKYPIDLFALSTRGVDASEIIDGADGHYTYERTKGGILGRAWFSGDTEGDKRYSYAVLELPKSGTVFLDVSERVQPVLGNKVGLHSQKPDELVKGAQNSVQVKSTVFMVLWVVLVLAELGGLGYAVFRYEDY